MMFTDESYCVSPVPGEVYVNKLITVDVIAYYLIISYDPVSRIATTIRTGFMQERDHRPGVNLIRLHSLGLTPFERWPPQVKRRL